MSYIDEIRDKHAYKVRTGDPGYSAALNEACAEVDALRATNAALTKALDGLPNLQEKIRKALADVTPGADTDPDDVDIMRAELQAAKEDAERARGSAQQEKEHHDFYRSKVSAYMGAEIEWQSKLAALSAECEALREDKARLREAIQRIRMMCSEDYNEHDPFDRIAPACMEALKL